MKTSYYTISIKNIMVNGMKYKRKFLIEIKVNAPKDIEDWILRGLDHTGLNKKMKSSWIWFKNMGKIGDW